MSTAPARHPARHARHLADRARSRSRRLIKVEMRKMVDTRAGLWLLITIGVITAVFMVIFFFALQDDERTFANYMGVTATPQGFLLPVLGILLVTRSGASARRW